MSKSVEEAWREWRDSYEPSARKMAPIGAMSIAFQAGYEAGAAHGAAEEREAAKQDVINTRIVGPANDSAYHLGFNDACDDIERRIRQRGERGDG